MKCKKVICYHNHTGRVSAFISQGSLSVEAAFAAPFFLLALLCILYLFQLIYTGTVLKTAFYSAARQIAQEAYVSTAFPGSRLENYIIDNLGEERVNQSLIEKGIKGIDCSSSYCYGDSGIMELSLRYRLQIPVLFFQIPIVEKEETLRIKGWIGYVEAEGSREAENMVYITDTGMVYHSTPTCNYLDLSIRRVSLVWAKTQYGSCSLCKEKGIPGAYVYVTTYGTGYHTGLDCSGLKRSIYAVRLSEVYGRGGCKKCVK